MREIKAIIRPNRLEAVLEALHTHPELPGVTISQVRGFGRTVTQLQEPSETPIQYGAAEMVKLECVVTDDALERIIHLIQSAAHTGWPGDGKVFVCDVAQVVKIRTGARQSE